MLAHLAQYAIFDDVTVEDLTGETVEFHIAGPAIGSLGLEPSDGPTNEVSLGGGLQVTVIRESPTGLPGITVVGRLADAPALCGWLAGVARDAGGLELDRGAFEALRIEAGTPLSGIDVRPENLPQEIGRDALAIHFKKGCYLGQETVARIDALGHVNRRLSGFRLIEGPIDGATPGTPLIDADGKEVGRITSIADSPGMGPSGRPGDDPRAIGRSRDRPGGRAGARPGSGRRLRPADDPARPRLRGRSRGPWRGLAKIAGGE